jgi:hypothetical protein
MRVLFIRAVVVAAATVGSAASSAKAMEASGTTYIGKLQGGPASARVAVVADGDSFTAYVCSGEDEFNQKASRWFKGAIDGGTFSAERDGIKLSGTVTAAGIEGTMTMGEETSFVAKPADEATLAGLFRAEFSDGEDDMVAGWIVDENDDAVGAQASKNGKKRKTARAPKNENGVPSVSATNADGQKVSGQRVGDPKNLPTGLANRLVTPELRKQLLDGLAERAAARGANPIPGIVLQEAKRFLAGEKPEGKLEEKVFGILKKIPKALLKEYVSDWDKIPADVRRKLVGAAALALDPSKPVTADSVRGLLRGGGARASTNTSLGLPSLTDPFGGMVGVTLLQQSGDKGVTSIDFKTLKCINPTGVAPGKILKDEIFVQTVVVAGAASFERKSAVYKFKAGESKSLSSADARVFPAEGGGASDGEVVLTVGLFEDDAEDIKKARDVVSKLSAAATAIVTVVKPALAEGVQTATKTAEGIIDALAAALPETVLLGTETLVVRPDGSTVDKEGRAKTKLVYQARRKSGKLKFHYEIAPIAVK